MDLILYVCGCVYTVYVYIDRHDICICTIYILLIYNSISNYIYISILHGLRDNDIMIKWMSWYYDVKIIAMKSMDLIVLWTIHDDDSP